jgi:hypothetical protein
MKEILRQLSFDDLIMLSDYFNERARNKNESGKELLKIGDHDAVRERIGAANVFLELAKEIHSIASEKLK